MVRRVVGGLVKVGAGDLSPVDFTALLRGREPRGPSTAEWTAPPSGLFLERVLYAGDPPLAKLSAVVGVSAET
jgi:tRNA U38,U39,U40 pseudouridine synthase TruA